ncbi:3-hydroxyacyl-CoA dehydrogenase NAD-binding domain-containing protein [Sphingobium sp. EP60837]|uniref:3-hydroxyacyl-CoA dehydrogenase NAD-binding domain-containing protein n=1 Tax=Sphingobium sp. EP60837 TaxID=1855519 RepID=UPI0007DD499D|nr:3-hydroxyacyl-CoA dehydrogenase NAD-binding domain-containing protein [Sphingobium sp. EP60837]ANI79732.1 3-hydroxyacyl-CoA dehydrogenase [Sphingobium sp. EP60837]
MSDTVSFHTHGAIAEAVIDNPPVNATSASVRQGLAEAIRKTEADPKLAALVIRCEGKTFIAGADIKEFGKPMADPGLPEVMQMMDRATKPIIAAVHGTVLGGGLEVALACHYRIAAPGTKFGFPEVKLGLMPGGGGTQRTPRLAGLATAIKLVTEGNQIGTDDALKSNLIDAVASGGDLAAAARAFAEGLVAEGKGPRSSSTLPMPADDPALFEEARKAVAKKMRGQTAPLRALDAMRLAYELPFDEAVRQELAIFRECMHGAQSKALRHMFAAEREVTRIPGLPADTATRPVERVGVIGLGVMGRGIVMALVTAGFPVIAVGLDPANVDAAMKAITKMWSSSVAKGSMSQEAMDKRMALITTSGDPRDLSATQLVIEAVTEDLEIKKAVFAQLGQVTQPGTILASNTSFLNIDTLAEASGRGDDVCGMHFFNPAHVMRLLENVRAAKTDPEVVATIMALGKRIGKLPVLSGVCDGFIVNRMLSKRSREGFFLVEEGAKPAAIDKVLLSYGFPMGPFALGDLAGLDVQVAARKARAATATERELRADFPEQMVAQGRLGQKTGSGWYSYDENRKASPNPQTDAMIAAHAERHGLTLREIGEDEIRERLLYAMVNEGAKLLSEGIVPRPHEIDVALVNGLGWPSYTGGPMHWADQIGLDKVLATIEAFRADQGDAYWTPAPLLVQYAREGRGFYA